MVLNVGFNCYIFYVQKLIFCFLLESVVHRGVRGYGTYCHVKNADEVFRKIDEWHKTILKQEVKVKLHDKEDVYTLANLKENLCGDYFQRYFENTTKVGPLVIPQIPNGINKIVDTMQRWCNDTNDSSHLKGLVVHSFNISEYFRKLFYNKFEKEKLRKDLDIKNFPPTPIIMVYNPSENVILLIRQSGEEIFGEQIEFCSHDVKMFMLLFGDEVKRSKIKVISLLATNEMPDENLKCEDCKNCIVSFETLESDELFQDWFHSHAENFNADIDNIDEINIIATSAKLVGCIAAAPYFDDLPTFTEVPNEQMKHFLVNFNHAQKNILCSGNKHLIIQGPYGSGKSIIARKKMQMLSDELKISKRDELVHFVCFDSESALLSEIGKSPYLIIHSNKGEKKLSEIVNNIMKLANNDDVNLIVDEYDGESLDEEAAEKLNDIFEENFQDTTVFLVLQSIEKFRSITIKETLVEKKKHRFDLLKKFQRVDLHLVMRNSIEIKNLIEVTQHFLEEQRTIYRLPRQKIASKASTYHNEGENDLATNSGEKKDIHVNNEEQQSIRELQLSEAVINKNESLDNATYKETENGGERVSLAAKSKRAVKNPDERAVGCFGLDEAFGFAGTPRANKNDKNIIVNRFRYIASTGVGHNISSCHPKLFEVNYDNPEEYSFEKFLVLTRTFRKLNIRNSNTNNKHVILHFNTSTNEIPKLLFPVIEYFKISHKVTNNYEDFKHNKSKSILVCNFRKLRGLEHSNVTIIIDQDIYSVQHYLVEAMARSTNKLNIVVLEKTDTISKIIAQWEDGLNGHHLIDHWKVQISKGEKKKIGCQNDTKLKLITTNDSSNNLEEMQKIFNQHVRPSRACNIARIAEKIILKR